MEQTLSILTIEDEPLIRQGIVNYLEDQGYTVLEAGDGQEGLEVFRRDKPDILLVDLQMPVIDGFEVLDVVQQESPETPVIVISGVGILQQAAHAVELGAWDFITKPIEDMFIVKHAIQKSWERAMLVQENKKYREKRKRHTEEIHEQKS
ncbi:MAG: response regulator [SAR324 cluster bacterium]|nr:response regulator [SAR324 cluster bacterium]